MDTQKKIKEAQAEISRLKKMIIDSRKKATDLEKTIMALENIHVFRCYKNSDHEYIVSLSEGEIADRNNIRTEKVKGKKIEDIIGEEHFLEQKQNYDRAFNGEIVKFRDVLSDGRNYYTILTPLFEEKDGSVLEIIGQTILITDIFQHEIENRKKAEILNHIIENNPYSIQILDADGHHILENKAFIDLFKTVPDKEWSILEDPIIKKSDFFEVLLNVLKGDVVKVPPIWYNAHSVDPKYLDNPVCVGSVIFPVILNGSKVEKIVVMHEDITIRIRAEEEMVKAKEKAEDADRLKTVFLANMSHEIRTPMNGILGFAELLKTPDLAGDKQLKYIRIIEQSGERMLNIINDLITISKLDTGHMEVSFSETNLNEQLEFLYDFFDLEANKKGLHLGVHCNLTNSKVIIYTDREKVLVILTNLIKNALKFTNSGSVEFGYDIKNGEIEFFVKDTGIGISPDKQKVVFERFVQADSSISSMHEGSGLGLAIAKAYVEMLGGMIWVESEVGKGTHFYFTIPDNKNFEIKHQNRDETEVVLTNEMINATILIAEDDEYSLVFLTSILENKVSRLLLARTGEEAVELCRNNRDVNLVLMDIKMPVMDGHTAAILIKEFLPDLPIIAQTAFALEIEKEKYREAFDDYITKPIKVDELKHKILKFFKPL